MLFEETTGTLFCGDLFTPDRRRPALTSDDIVEPALAAEEMFHGSAWRPTRRDAAPLGDLEPTTLALMHGPSFSGDGRRAFYDLATAYEHAVAAA